MINLWFFEGLTNLDLSFTESLDNLKAKWVVYDFKIYFVEDQKITTMLTENVVKLLKKLDEMKLPRMYSTNEKDADVPKIRRTFLATEEMVAKIFASSELKSVEKFYDFVYDTNDLHLIKDGYLLLLRVINDECHWRLRKSTNNIAETEDAILKRLSELTKGSGTYITDFAPCIFSSMFTVRFRFSDLWIDFSSWCCGGISGLYATITCYKDLNATIVPNRYYVCMKDTRPNAFNSVFKLDCSYIYANIIRDTNHIFSLSYNKIKTYEDVLNESDEY